MPGRKSGPPHSTPVDVIKVSGQRWLVTGYGPANWVLNTRAAGQVQLSRGGHTETYTAEEAAAEDAIPVLRTYITKIRVTRPTSTPPRTRPTKRSRPSCPGMPSSG